MKYVIIGNSAAGIAAAENIRRIDTEGSITVITDEKYHTYSRPLISYLLMGKTTVEKMKYRPNDFYEEHNITLLTNTAVTKIDVEKSCVCYNGGSIPYDKLLTATGSRAFVPPFSGLDTVEQKYTFQNLNDAMSLGNALGSTCDKRVLIIGAGLIGLKCAEGIHKRAKEITVVDIADRILPGILDADAAGYMRSLLEAKGIRFMLKKSVAGFDHNIARFDTDEESVVFDILVIAVGVRPNTSLLEGIADIDKGIIVNERSQTSAGNIYAAGDCTQTVDVSAGQSKIMALLPNAYMQGECAGINMAGGDKVFDKAIPMNAAGFFGTPVITAGNYVGEVYTVKTEERFKRLYYSNNLLNGYILIGNIEKAGIYTSLIRDKIPLDTIDFELVCEKPGLMAFTKDKRAEKLGGGTA